MLVRRVFHRGAHLVSINVSKTIIANSSPSTNEGLEKRTPHVLRVKFSVARVCVCFVVCVYAKTTREFRKHVRATQVDAWISNTGHLYTYHSLMSISSRFLLVLLPLAPFFRGPLNGWPEPAAPSNAAFGSWQKVFVSSTL